MTGKFIVFEGIDGSGKTTQANLLAEYLKSKGIKVWLTKEPTDGQTGQLLQKIQRGEFKDYFKNSDDFKRFMMYLYSADRVGHCQQINEHLDDGEWVICDRYKYSTYAYNGTNDFNLKYEILSNFPDPDLTIFIDVPMSYIFSRIESRGKDKEIFEEENYLSEVIDAYYYLLDSKVMKEVDGAGSVKEVFDEVRSLVDHLIED